MNLLHIFTGYLKLDKFLLGIIASLWAPVTVFATSLLAGNGSKWVINIISQDTLTWGDCRHISLGYHVGVPEFTSKIFYH